VGFQNSIFKIFLENLSYPPAKQFFHEHLADPKFLLLTTILFQTIYDSLQRENLKPTAYFRGLIILVVREFRK
jgi:hypothetical protein